MATIKRPCLGCGKLIPKGQSRCARCKPRQRNPEAERIKRQQLGKDQAYGHAWRKARAAAIKRDKVCQRCGTGDDLTVHHRKPYRLGGGIRLDNLVTYCRRCHNIVEAAERRARKRADRGRRRPPIL
jgi:5-methylcytosine-specific restriction endonuclease McrA